MIDMNFWDFFIWFGIAAVVLSATGAVVSMCAKDHWSESSVRYRRRRTAAVAFASSALVVMAVFIVHRYVAGCLVCYVHVVTLLCQADECTSHRDHVIVRMR